MSKRSRITGKDYQQLARSVLDTIAPDAEPKPEKNPAAVALGRLGGLKGGPARKAASSKRKLSADGRKAANARWAKYRKDKKSEGGALAPPAQED